MTASILIVEDEPDIRELLDFSITRAGFDVLAVESAEAALQAMDKRMVELAAAHVGVVQSHSVRQRYVAAEHAVAQLH